MAQKTLGQRTAPTDSGKAPELAKAGPDFSIDHEKWLYENPEALAAVKRGLADSAAGRGVKMSFLEFADLDINE